jgi:zinc/manganese transport system substrate-binding protein
VKLYIFKSIFTTWLVISSWSSVSWAGLNVVTTTSDLGSIAKEVGGSLIKVNSLVKGYQDPHYIQPKPSYMVKMNRADLLIYQGLELEIGWLPVLIEGARNPNIRWGQPGHLDASTGIPKLEILSGEVDRSMGDIHPDGNPHYHLDPENGFIIALSIFNKLSELDPENASQYRENLDRFNKKLAERISHWKKQMAVYRGTKIVTYHKLWSYFLNRFGLSILNTVEVKPGVSPSTRHLAMLTSQMKRQNIKLVVQATYYSSEFSDMVAEKVGGSVLTLPAFVGGTSKARDYFSLFDTIVEELRKVLPSTL